MSETLTNDELYAIREAIDRRKDHIYGCGGTLDQDPLLERLVGACLSARADAERARAKATRKGFQAALEKSERKGMLYADAFGRLWSIATTKRHVTRAKDRQAIVAAAEADPLVVQVLAQKEGIYFNRW